MSFLFPTVLTIGLPLLVAPILIHLLNLRRQQRVQWAAMEFLLQSDRRNRRWVRLREWLLMAARVLAIGLVVAMLSGPQLAGELAGLFANERTHHVLIVDDSFSMGARTGGESVWERLQRVATDVITSASRSPRSRVSVIRVSTPDATTETASGRAELATLRRRLGSLGPGPSAADLGGALRAAARLASAEKAAGPVVAYVLSDFRSRNLAPATRFAAPLGELAGAASAVRLAACASGPADNVAVTSLRLAPGPRVADLELTAEVRVRNFGRRPVEVTAAVTAGDRGLPVAPLGVIPPREARTATFPIRFDGAGNHAMRVELEPDALDADNDRSFAARLPAERRLLLVDGSPGGVEGLVFSAALRPSGVPTGWRPERAHADRLAEINLEGYEAVLLLDVPVLPGPAAAKLMDYAAAGGGVLLTLGPAASRSSYNSSVLVDSDRPLLPIRLGGATQAPSADTGDRRNSGDLDVNRHPVFRVFDGDRNSFLQLLAVNYYREIEFPGGPGTGANVIATLRGGAPLVLEAARPDRRVLCLLTTVARSKGAIEGWSNLGASPVFPVLANEVAAYLTDLRTAPPVLLVGDRCPGGVSPVPWRLAGGTALAADRGPTSTSPAAPNDSPAAGGAPRGDAAVFAAAGYYVLPSHAVAEAGASQAVAVNLDPAEGDLAGPTPGELRELVSQLDLGVAVDTPAQFRRASRQERSSDVGRLLAVVLMTVLVGEKLLGVLASYHGSRRGGAG